MPDFVTEMKKEFTMGEKEENIRYAIGSAAAATAIFAPLGYTWRRSQPKPYSRESMGFLPSDSSRIPNPSQNNA